MPVTIDSAKHPKGAGDVFAIRLLCRAFLDRMGFLRREPDLATGLQHARFAAAGLCATGCHLRSSDVEAAIRSRPDYQPGGSSGIRITRIPRPHGSARLTGPATNGGTPPRFVAHSPSLPEIQGKGGVACAAVLDLIQQLIVAVEWPGDEFHRGIVREALAEALAALDDTERREVPS